MSSNSNNKIIAVLLCGGKSTRMGSDKGLLSTENKRWFERNYDLLSGIFSRVVISIHPGQDVHYKTIRPELEYIKDTCDFAEGPLTGILSVHEKYPDHDLFILACDMIAMDESTIRNLATAYDSTTGNDFYFYQNEFYLETLCGIYTSKGIKQIHQKITTAYIKEFAIHKLISDCNSLVLSIDAEQKKAFTNWNSPEEVEHLHH